MGMGPSTAVADRYGNFFFGMQVADMNNDGNADIVATLYEPTSYPLHYDGWSRCSLWQRSVRPSLQLVRNLGELASSGGNFVNDDAPDVVTSTSYGMRCSSARVVAILRSPLGIINRLCTADTLTATLTSSLPIALQRPVRLVLDGTTPLGPRLSRQAPRP